MSLSDAGKKGQCLGGDSDRMQRARNRLNIFRPQRLEELFQEEVAKYVNEHGGQPSRALKEKMRKRVDKQFVEALQRKPVVEGVAAGDLIEIECSGGGFCPHLFGARLSRKSQRAKIGQLDRILFCLVCRVCLIFRQFDDFVVFFFK